MVQLRCAAIVAVFAIAALRGSAAQEAAPVPRPSFAGTWTPADPIRSEALFNDDVSTVAGVAGKGRLIIEHGPDRLTLTRQLSDDMLDKMLNLKGRFDTTKVYRIVVPQAGGGGFGAGGDMRASWQGDRLVLPMLGVTPRTSVVFALDGERLKVEMHVVVSPGKENNTPEWFTRVK